MVSSNFPNRPFRLEENCWIRYQDVGSNFSNVGGELWIRKNSYSPTWSNGTSNFTFYINGGQVAGWNFTIDFRNSDALRLCYIETNVGHNADGSKWFAIDGYANVQVMGYTEVHSGIQAPTIPRASTASFPGGNWLTPGVTAQIDMNTASGSFTHDVDYYFGNASGRALTQVVWNGYWAPPMSLLDQIPNSTTGTGKIRNHTYSGGSMIGWTETAFGITAPSSVIPTWTSAIVEENTAGLAAIIGSGVYLQGVSKLKGTITGAAGVYSSTITAQTHSAGGETVSGSTGTFTQPIAVSGTSVPVVQTVTDTRGRQKTQTTNINVLPYSRPVISAFTVDRVNASNQPDPVGTKLRLNITGAVQSIINSTERNRLTLRVYTKVRSATEWGSPTNIVVDSTSLAYNAVAYLTGPFLVSNAYDIKIELIDKFNTTPAQTQVGTGEVFQHWATGLGVGKYWENGMLDVKGAIFHGGGAIVEPVGTVVAFAGSAIPAGWLLCDGQAVSRTTYAALFAALSTTYGTGNGTSTFNVPNYKGRALVGMDTGQTEFNTMGKVGGAKTHTLTSAESGLPAHNHYIGDAIIAWGPGNGWANGAWTAGGYIGGINPTTNTVSANASQAHNNLQPYATVNYIIKAL